jgi:ATP-dependent DNA ligase
MWLINMLIQRRQAVGRLKGLPKTGGRKKGSVDHEIKWDGYRIIARKDGERVRIWARTGTDYTASLGRIREAIAALPVR